MRRPRRRPALDRDLGAKLALTTVGLLALAVVTGVIPIPSLGDFLADLSDTLGAWTYLVIPVLAFLETAAFVGLVIPGETAVLVGGVVAERGEVSLVILILLVWALAVAGDLVSFLLGRRLGRQFLVRHGRRFGVRTEHLDRVEVLFEHHGGKTIVFGRFVGVLRTLTPFVAGTSGLTLRRFLPYSIGGALAWVATFTLLGYAFSGSFTAAGDIVTRVTLAGAALVALVLWMRRRPRRQPPAPVAGVPSHPLPRPSPA